MKNPSTSIVSTLTRFGLTLGIALSIIPSTFAADSSILSLSASNPSQSLSLAGEVTHTIYKEEQYETTCSRQEPYTVYRTECSYRDVQRCTTVSTGRTCSPVCRDVTRQVCNSSGCRNVTTRECTQSCRPNPPRQVCSTERVAYNCREVPHTAYRTVHYSCIKTRTVPAGVETDKIISADVSVSLSGDVAGLTGKDKIRVSVANGNDISRADIAIESVASADTHFLKVTKSEQVRPIGPKQIHIEADYLIEAIPLSSVLSRLTKVTDLEANRGSITFTTSGQSIDGATVVKVVSRKDQLIGGLKTDLEMTVKGKDIQVSNIPGGQSVVVDFGTCVNKRPHEMTVIVTSDASVLLGGGILNPSAVEKAKNALTSKLTKRMKMKGDNRICSGE